MKKVFLITAIPNYEFVAENYKQIKEYIENELQESVEIILPPMFYDRKKLIEERNNLNLIFINDFFVIENKGISIINFLDDGKINFDKLKTEISKADSKYTDYLNQKTMAAKNSIKLANYCCATIDSVELDILDQEEIADEFMYFLKGKKRNLISIGKHHILAKNYVKKN